MIIFIIVVILIVLHLRSSILISMMLPLAVLATFIAMKQFGVDANVVALSGIADPVKSASISSRRRRRSAIAARVS